MKLINSHSSFADAIDSLQAKGFELSCTTPDGGIYKNKFTFEFVKLTYEKPFWHVYQPENINQ